jgi:methyl-accepting chemotaxis protein
MNTAPTAIRRIPFASSLAGRLLLLGVLPGALLMGALLWWGAVEKFEYLESMAEGELLREALHAASGIEESNFAAMQAARSIAVEQEAGLFGKRALTVDLLKAVLANDTNVTAAYVAYEPNADGGDAASLAGDPKEWLDATGRFIPYPFRDWTRGDAIGVKPLVDYETSLYYDGVRRALADAGKPVTVVTEPYVYDGQLIVEQSHPILIGGRFRGIGAVDRGLTGIEAKVRAGAARIGADAYLVSGRGRFIVATTDPAISPESIADLERHLRTNPLAGSAVDAMLAPLVRDADADGEIRAARAPDGRDMLCASVRIVSGGWTLVFVESRDEVLAPIRAQVAWNGAIFVVALGVACGLVVWTALMTGRRMRNAAIAADAIADGNLATVIPPCPLADEAGVMTRSLQRMQASLNALLRGVRGAGVTLDSSAVELAATSREQEAMAHRIGESSSQIAAASREISATGADLARTMAEVEKAVASTAELASGSRAGLASVDATIRGLAEASAAIAAKLSAISERASAINGVVTTIAKVADQTNLLSVNAAIEAEKAGEQGRGFLVVAREIRRLADQTASATGDIEGIVREMQGAVGEGVMEMDRFSEKVRRSVDEIVRTGRQMGSIIEEVHANAERYRTVADGMQSQAQGAQTISDSMGALAAAARRSVETAEEFGRTADELKRASQTLRASVAQFSLREESR